MLQPLMHRLNAKRIVLASGSPRRKTILGNIGLKFEVVPSSFEENLDKSKYEHPYDYAKETAKQKTLEVARKLALESQPPDLVIGADTVVTMDDKVFEKPTDKEDAFRILSGGRCHTVYTGVILVTPKDAASDDTLTDDERFNLKSFHAATDVEFAELTPEIIRSYIDTGEPMDKAGGYGIQAAGGTLVKGIKGDYFNVMGFPLHMFSQKIVEIFGTSNDTINKYKVHE